MVFRNPFASSLQIGDVAPAFQLSDQDGKTHNLSDYKGRWLVLYFYPKDNTLGCTQEACSFRDNIALYRGKDVTVIGVSADSVESHKGFAEKHGLPFPILADTTKATVKAYGALLPLGLPNRITYIIDPEGRIADRLDWVRWDTYAETVMERLAKLR